MPHAEIASWIVLIACLGVIAVPNYRTGLIKNSHCGAILAAGVAMLFVRLSSAAVAGDELHWLFWGVATIALIGAGVGNWLPGGIVKLHIAMLPWLDAKTFLWLLTIGGCLHLILLRWLPSADPDEPQNKPYVPALIVACVAMGAYQLATGAWA